MSIPNIRCQRWMFGMIATKRLKAEKTVQEMENLKIRITQQPEIIIAVMMSLHWVSRAKRLDTRQGNQMNLITFQAAYHIE